MPLIIALIWRFHCTYHVPGRLWEFDESQEAVGDGGPQSNKVLVSRGVGGQEGGVGGHHGGGAPCAVVEGGQGAQSTLLLDHITGMRRVKKE